MNAEYYCNFQSNFNVGSRKQDKSAPNKVGLIQSRPQDKSASLSRVFDIDFHVKLTC